MQCFWVRYRGICQVACSTVSHEKALHNYFIPCLNLRKTYGNFGKTSEISANFQKLRKRFKPVFEEFKRFMKVLENFGNSSKVFSRCYYDFLKFSKNPWISSEVFGNLRQFSENFGSGSKVIFRWFFFYDFLKIFGKSSEVLENLRKISGRDRANVRNGSQELKSFGAGFWRVLKWTPVNCCAQVMTGE